jgi:hypothetical protein
MQMTIFDEWKWHANVCKGHVQQALVLQVQQMHNCQIFRMTRNRPHLDERLEVRDHSDLWLLQMLQ